MLKLVENHQDGSSFVFSYIISTLGSSEKFKKYMQKDSYFKMKVYDSRDDGLLILLIFDLK